MSSRAPYGSHGSQGRAWIRRIRLINWHGHENATLDVMGDMLAIIGENGSGKSLILDAIDWALFPTSNKQFNAAAREGGRTSKRTLSNTILFFDPHGIEHANKGWRRQRTVGYCAVEVEHEGEGRWVYGAAAAATPHSSHPWYYALPTTLDQIAFLEVTAQGQAPLQMQDFRARNETFVNTGGAVFNATQAEDYNRLVARRLLNIEGADWQRRYDALYDVLHRMLGLKVDDALVSDPSGVVRHFLPIVDRPHLERLVEGLEGIQRIHRDIGTRPLTALARAFPVIRPDASSDRGSDDVATRGLRVQASAHALEADIAAGMKIFAPKGCDSCTDGYKGRVGIYQVLPVTETIARIILASGSAVDIGAQAVKEGVWDLRRSGLEKVKAGLTRDDDKTGAQIKTFRDWSRPIEPFLNTVNLDRYTRLGLFDDLPLPAAGLSSARILQYLIETRWKMNESDRDMILMLHEIDYELNGTAFFLKSSLMVKGENALRTAMAKTVGLPLGIAARLILEEKINVRGLQIPIIPEIYLPVLEELSKEGILFQEEIS